MLHLQCHHVRRIQQCNLVIQHMTGKNFHHIHAVCPDLSADERMRGAVEETVTDPVPANEFGQPVLFPDDGGR